MPTIAISYDQSRKPEALALARQLKLPLLSDRKSYDYLLHFTTEHLALVSCHQRYQPLFVDFLSGDNWHRYRYGGGKGQLIAKACGIKTSFKPQILDLTGGLARDAFVLASLGCDVTLLERQPIIAALLEDGIKRAKNSPLLHSLTLTLIKTDAIQYLSNLDTAPEVIYIDPMYPHREKSALVKKEMRILRDIVGDDDDSTQLLQPALALAKKKVVVKRPYHAPYLCTVEPDLIHKGKSSRFDIYLTAKRKQKQSN